MMILGRSMTLRAESSNRLTPRREEVSVTGALPKAEPLRLETGAEVRRETKAGNGFQQPERLTVKWSSYKGLTVDTLAHRGDEGRVYLR